jgi:hypothetical protein
VALTFLVGAGVFVWVVFWFWPPPPARIVLVGAGYETNLAVPHNVYGREGLRSLAAWAGDRPDSFYWRSGLLQLKSEPTELVADAAWDRGLDDAGDRTVMLVFALHGGADADGAYLLRGDAAPERGERGKLLLADILERLKRLPARTNKLLVLDATGMGPNWTLGMLHNDFARALERMGPDIAAVPNLAVVSASGPDQLSWPAESVRRTVFGHYLQQGLKGAADENKDERINAWELYHYVADRVERWTRANRDAIQTPVLLPQGEEGERRARAMHLTLVASPGPDEDPPSAVPAVANAEELRRAWDLAQELSRLTPPPDRYAPYAWARYRAAVLRYEQLLRAGDEESAATVAGLLPELEQKIRQAGRLNLASAENTLAMTALTGPGPPPDPARAWFNSLWGAGPDDLRTRWEDLQKGKDAPTEDAARRRLRLRLAELAIEEAARDPVGVGRAARLVRLVHDPLRPLAAEAHFLAMLDKNLPKTPPPANLLSEALRLRLLAEQAALAVRPDAAPYSEQVFPWVRAAVEDADRQRALGQDLLFASAPERFDEAAEYFRQARKSYERAVEDGAAVAAALAARDRAFTEVPAYAHWVAQRPGSEDPVQHKADEELLAQIEQVAGDAHRLAESLEKRPEAPLTPSPLPPGERGRGEGPSPALEELGRESQAVRQGLNALEGEFLRRADELTGRGGLRTWLEAEAALAVPFPDSDLRRRLIDNDRAIEGQLARKGADRAFPVNPDMQRRAAMDQARRQGRAALAVLGRRLFDEQAADRGGEKYDLVEHRLEVFTVEQNWWESLDRAGEQVGRRWRRLAADAAARLGEGRQEDLARARAALRDADRLARRIDGAAEPDWEAEPADRLLRLSAHDLLLWQARRTLEDHWFGENGEPYYQKAGLAYVEDARRLVAPAQAARGALPAEEELNRPGRLALGPAGRLALTSETELPFECTLAPEPGAYVPPGLPSFRLEAGPAVTAAFPGGKPYRVADLRAGRSPDPVGAVVGRPAAADGDGPLAARKREQAEVVLHGFFRGQPLDARVPVEVQPFPERVYYEYPAPRTRAVVVRADRRLQEEFGPGAGAVAIVLDCSGSMGADEKDPKAPTKFDEVARALETVLRKLPKGTTLSLWVFGQAQGGRKSVDAAEDTIRRLQAPVAWDGEDADQVRGLMTRVRALEPWNETPLVRAMLEAKEDLVRAKGFRTLLVLTDGMDNRFDKDPRFRGKTIPKVIKDEFQDAGVAVNLIGFKFAGGEQEKAYEQFKGIAELPLPGKFVPVEEADKLAIELERALKQKIRYWVERDDGRRLPDVSEDGLGVSLSDRNDQWFTVPDKLSSSGFKVRMQTNRGWEQSVSLGPGELLELQLRPGDGGRHELRRVFVAADDYGDRPGTPPADWRLAVLQNQRLADRRLQMLLMLDKSPEGPEPVLRQVRPRETWVELEAAEAGAEPFGLRWSFQPGYAATAYSLDVPAWPARPGGDAPARPVIRAWWSMGEVEADAFVQRDRALPTLLGLRNVSRTADGAAVVVESVQVEQHRVEVRPGRFEPRDCLVVRLSCPPGKPFKVEPVGLSPAGQEHRFYSGVGKTTALFWPVSSEEAHDALDRLNLISLERFKADADRHGYHLELKTLKEPTRQDARPQPPVEMSYVPE